GDGYDLITGFIDGAQARITQLLNWISGLPGWVTGSIDWNVSFNSIFNSGYDLMSGLASGLYRGFLDLVTPMLTWITDQIPDWKGPREKDLRLLYESGQTVMAGFSAGLMAGFSDVERTLGTITGSLVPAVIVPQPAAAASRTVQAGGVVINVHGAGDPEAVAQAVYRNLDAAFGRLELEVRR
ncbi:MAG TPA: hypothetical protein VH475_13165, partial [Tepidisphaeraceae bacterium]